MLISYAQNFEDVLLWRALKEVDDGFYIDVGAQDPAVDSVSKLFYEHGWRGIHVEPTPEYARQLRADRPEDQIVEQAVSSERGELTFYEIPGTGISTGDAAIAEGHRQRGFEVREIAVRTVTLADILEKAGGRAVHWLKIDIEGMEYQALAGWGNSSVLPWIVVVESTLPLTTIEAHFDWEPLLLNRGYVFVYFDGLNRYYVSPEKTELAQYFDHGAGLIDDFSLSGLASAPFCRHILEQGRVAVADLQGQLQVANDVAARRTTEKEALVAALRGKDQLYAAKLSASAGELSMTAGRLVDVQREARELEGGLRARVERLGNDLLEAQKHARDREADLQRSLLSMANDQAEAQRQAREREGALHNTIENIQSASVVREQQLRETIDQLNSDHRASVETVRSDASVREQQLREAIDQLNSDHRTSVETVRSDAALREQDLKGALERASAAFETSSSGFSAREEGLKGEINHLKTQVDEKAALIVEAGQRLNDAQAQSHRSLAEWSRKADELQQRSELISRAADEMYGHLQGVQDHLAAVRGSHSWKVTKPLRSLKRLVTGSPATEDNPVPVFTWPTDLSLAVPAAPAVSAPAPAHGPDTYPAHADIAITALDDLLQLADVDFVYAMYRSLLKREPDEGGLSSNLKRIRQGDDKRRIVFDIRTSAEGRLVNVVLPGLITRRSRLRALASRIRLLWRKMTGKEAMDRAVRTLENQIGILRLRQTRYDGLAVAKSQVVVDVQAPVAAVAERMPEQAAPLVSEPADAVPESTVTVGPVKKTTRVGERVFFDLVMSR